MVHPGASWRILKIQWRILADPEDEAGRVVALQGNFGVNLHLKCQFTSCASQASDAQEAQDAANNFC